ncbi:MAG: hypothetical protein LBU89_13300 [Fibromonadaceae bacterium]|jgi:outer membrane lipoprotein-sorting protein|nr:hypothetical protein [Fibromonadaceae bacterium]
MKKLLFLLLLCIASFCSAADSFLTSCQQQWQANAKAMKSMRADMVQSVEIAGQKAEQKAKVQYLVSDRFYSKTEMDSHIGKMTMLCRGDTTYIRMGNSGWNAQQGNCSENPLEATVNKLKNLKLSFSKDSSGSRIYRAPDDTRYVFEAKTCRLMKMDIAQDGIRGISSFQYQNFENIDFPVKTEIDLPGKGKTSMEYRSVLMNKGVTKAFFELD